MSSINIGFIWNYVTVWYGTVWYGTVRYGSTKNKLTIVKYFNSYR